jgi:hypothetical protein
VHFLDQEPDEVALPLHIRFYLHQLFFSVRNQAIDANLLGAGNREQARLDFKIPFGSKTVGAKQRSS